MNNYLFYLAIFHYLAFLGYEVRGVIVAVSRGDWGNFLSVDINSALLLITANTFVALYILTKKKGKEVIVNGCSSGFM